jgi:hypothetical protein
MDKYRDLLGRICECPAMYVGHCSIDAVALYLAGYCHGISDCGQAEPPMYEFQRWAEMRFRIRHAAWNWTRILLHEYGDDRASVAAFPALYDEFRRDREQLGMEQIEAEATRRLMAAYGHNWGEPKETNTRPTST